MTRLHNLYAPIAAATAFAALLLELLFFPVLRALPEAVGMQAMLPLFFAMVLLASIGIFAGAAAFNRTRSRLGLLGFAVGQLVLISVILYFFRRGQGSPRGMQHIA